MSLGNSLCYAYQPFGWDGPHWYALPLTLVVSLVMTMGLVYIWRFRSARAGVVLAAFVGCALLLTGCPETPNTSLREQVREAEKASGYVNKPGDVLSAGEDKEKN